MNLDCIFIIIPFIPLFLAIYNATKLGNKFISEFERGREYLILGRWVLRAKKH